MKKQFVPILVVLLFSALSFSAFANITIQRFQKVELDSNPLKPAHVMRGSHPITTDDYQFLKDNGVKTIIDLRWGPFEMGGEEDEMAQQYGFGYKHLSMDDKFTMLASPREATINKVLQDVTDPNLQPVYVHCIHGKDRTGLIMALYRVRYQHWDRTAAFNEWSQMGLWHGYHGLIDFFWDHTPGGEPN